MHTHLYTFPEDNIKYQVRSHLKRLHPTIPNKNNPLLSSGG